MRQNLSIGYSPCPNDTFIFHALVHGLVDNRGVAYAEPFLADVEQLNLWAMLKKLDVTKLSFHAFGHVLDEYCLLAAGSALGRGCGPLIVGRPQLDMARLQTARIAIPGKYTTAALLLKMFLPNNVNLVEMRFDLIMDAVKDGRVDAGVIIHESRFTYQQEGLVCLQDLGEWWESSSGLPIPLGCIVARRSLGKEIVAAVEGGIRASIDYAYDHPDESRNYIGKHSQEMADAVVQSHIGLYVNEFSRDLGNEGMAAVTEFLKRGRMVGALPQTTLSLLLP